MDITQWYAVALGGLVSLSIIYYLLSSIVKIAHTYAASYFFKHVFYPQVHQFIRGSDEMTRFDVVLIVVFLIGNILCTTIGVEDISSLTKRAGLMSTINLMPLSLGGHMNFVASRCGIKLESYGRIHRWLGRAAIAESLVHVAAAASSQKPNLHVSSQAAALTAAVGMGTALLSSAAIVRRHIYEIFLKLHLILAAIVIVTVYLHGSSKNLLASPTVYLLAAVCLWALVIGLRFSQTLYRNINYGKPLNRATVRTITFKRQHMKDIPLSSAVHVHVRLSRPWKFRAGQYVYLCIPGVSHAAFAQSHPFYVSWWYRDEEGSDVIVFIIQKRRGFTKNLLLHANNDLDRHSEMRAIIEGPYGKEINLESYGTVLLFATDIGIAGQLPYVTQLLEGYHNCEVKTRRITLFWELDSELHTAWVADMMKELLTRDTKLILDIQLFVLGNYISSETKAGDIVPLGRRIQMIPITAEDLKIVCANDKISDQIREIIRHMPDRTIHLKELDFRPYSLQGNKECLTTTDNHRSEKDNTGSV
ncbi:MAG: hypothetical protein M1813_009690 [Trichoglossum hirsutum]|nr:MAG: hypothetical protein M1813_009690 [Trichoglossum hirsutum]